MIWKYAKIVRNELWDVFHSHHTPRKGCQHGVPPFSLNSCTTHHCQSLCSLANHTMSDINWSPTGVLFVGLKMVCAMICHPRIWTPMMLMDTHGHYGHPWILMDLHRHGHQWTSMDIHGSLWTSMDMVTNGSPWTSMDTHRNRLNSTEVSQ